MDWPTRRVSVLVCVVMAVAAQLDRLVGQAVMVEVRVLKTGDTETTGAVEAAGDAPMSVVPVAVAVAPTDPVMGQTVVDTTTVSVVTKVVLAEAGQFRTLEGHAVTVAVRVEKTVEVVNCAVD